MNATEPTGIQALLADQTIVAAIALVLFSLFVVLAYVFDEERKSRRVPPPELHSYRDDLETRSRRVQ